MRRLLVLLLAVPAGAGPALETRVAEAVEKGAGFLLSRFDRKKGWGGAMGTGTYGDGGPAYPYPAGPTALACFALLKAGVPPDHKVLKQAFSFLRLEHRTPAVAYEQSLQLLAVAEWAIRKRRTPRARTASA